MVTKGRRGGCVTRKQCVQCVALARGLTLTFATFARLQYLTVGAAHPDSNTTDASRATPSCAQPVPLAQLLNWRELINDGGKRARGGVSRRRVGKLSAKHQLLAYVHAAASWATSAAVLARRLANGELAGELGPPPFLPDAVVAEAGALVQRRTATRDKACMAASTVLSGMGTGIAAGVVKGVALGVSSGSLIGAVVGAAVGFVGGAVAGAIGIGASRATTAVRDSRTRA